MTHGRGARETLRLRARVLPAIAFLAAACQDPFAESRHDLASFRIVAVSAAPTESGAFELRAFAYSGYGMWWEEPPEMAWRAGGQSATGPRVTMDLAPPEDVELTVTAPDGQEESAVLALDAPPEPPTLEGFTRARVDLRVEDAARPIAERAAVAPGEDGVIEPGGAARLGAVGLQDGVVVRWMATGGQFAELDAHSTDWFAGTATLDDGEVESTASLGPGVRTVVGLAQDGRGGNRWGAVDVAVGLDGAFLDVGGRLFPVDAAEGGAGLWSVELASDDGPAGVRLIGVTPVEDATTGEGACGLSAGEPFDFAVLAEGACARDEVVGARVVVEARPWP